MQSRRDTARRGGVIALIGSPQSDRLFGQVVDKIAIGIVGGHFAAGEQLPNEHELNGGMPVSRTAYREAIKFLTAKGLIEAKPKSGTRVRPRSDWNLLDPDILRWTLQGGATIEFARDLFELRRCLEPDVARLAAQRRSDAQLADIEQALHGMENHKPLSDGAIAADLAFHEHLFAATNNQTLACLKSAVSTTILWSLRVKRTSDNGAFVRSIPMHRHIFEAVAARDGELAAAHSTTLIASALTDTELALNRQPESRVRTLRPSKP
jgi:GntR family transcriptional regulator, galactonate operon transcriptional repressor